MDHVQQHLNRILNLHHHHIGIWLMYRSVLSSSEDIKHSAIPAASLEPAEPAWFISRSLCDKNSSYSSVPLRLRHDSPCLCHDTIVKVFTWMTWYYVHHPFSRTFVVVFLFYFAYYFAYYYFATPFLPTAITRHCYFWNALFILIFLQHISCICHWLQCYSIVRLWNSFLCFVKCIHLHWMRKI